MKNPDGRAPFSSAVVRRSLEIQHDLQLAARTDLPVLITADPGYPVKPIAFWIHSRSDRYKTGLTVIDGSAPMLRQARMFDEAGRLMLGLRHDRSVTGTVLFTNVEGLPPHTQDELFQFLEVGGGSGRPPVRVIAATSLTSFSSSQDRRLRKDLFYRLNAIHIVLADLELRQLGLVQSPSERSAGKLIFL
jgi:DNA-binding NtrC family response regulator